MLNPFRPETKSKGRILAFHDVNDRSAFRKRMEWLKANFSIVSLDELLKNPDKNQLAITFDDGYQCWHSIVFPILKELEIPATFFVNSGLIGLEGDKMFNYFRKKCKRTESRLKAISKEELFEISQNHLFSIGGHTVDHIDLSESLENSEIEHQIIHDKQEIERLIEQEIHYFAYPFGQLQNAHVKVQKKVKEAGYKAAFTIIPGFVEDAESPFLINRDSLEFHQSEQVWKKWLAGAYDQLVQKKLNIYKFLRIRFR